MTNPPHVLTMFASNEERLKENCPKQLLSTTMAEGKRLNIPVEKKRKKIGFKHAPCCVAVVVVGGGSMTGGLAATPTTSFLTASERCLVKIQNHLIQGGPCPTPAQAQ